MKWKLLGGVIQFILKSAGFRRDVELDGFSGVTLVASIEQLIV